MLDAFIQSQLAVLKYVVQLIAHWFYSVIPDASEFLFATLFAILEDISPQEAEGAIEATELVWRYAETLFPVSLAMFLYGAFMSIYIVHLSLKWTWRVIPAMSW